MDMILKFNNKYKRITISLMVILLLFTFTVPKYKAEAAVVSLTAGALYFIYACSLAGVHMTMDEGTQAYIDFKERGGSDYQQFNISMTEYQNRTKELHENSTIENVFEKQKEIGSKISAFASTTFSKIVDSISSWLNTPSTTDYTVDPSATSEIQVMIHNGITAKKHGSRVTLYDSSDNQLATFGHENGTLTGIEGVVDIGGYTIFYYYLDYRRAPGGTMAYIGYNWDTGGTYREYVLDVPNPYLDNPNFVVPSDGMVGSLDTPIPYFPDSFVPDMTNPGDVVFDPSAPVTVPDVGFLNPSTGLVGHPTDWAGDWVSGVPYPGVAVPDSWAGDFPLDVPVDTTVPGDGTDAGENTGDPTYPVPVPSDIDFTPIMQVGNGIKDKFPFSLPWDFMRVVGSIASDPVAPNWELPLNVPGFKNESMTIDFSKFDKLALISRFFTTIIFIGALILATRKLISG